MAATGQSLLGAIPWLQQLLLVGLVATRFATAFALVPIFSDEIMPTTVRNSLIFTFGLIAFSLQMPPDVQALTPAGWAALFAKEALAGGTIGLFFGTILWAMTSAGELIDNKIGATGAQLSVPVGGFQTGLTGGFFARLGNYVFVGAGGITVLVGAVMESYALWPLQSAAPALDLAKAGFFEGEFGRFFVLVVLLSGPFLVVLYIADAGLGLVNRFAQQLNVFALAAPIKSALAVLMLIPMVPVLVDAVLHDLSERALVASGVLTQLAR